jgi:hypothetical protein
MIAGQKWVPLAALASVIALAAVLGWAQNPAQNQQQQKKAVEQQKQDETQDITEEEYDAYEKAKDETDLAKKATLLIAFMDKFPKSKLQPQIIYEYEGLMARYYEQHDYKTLEPLAEQWLKYKPDDLKTIAYVAESAQNLNHDAKFLEYGQRVYAVKPGAQLASLIYQAYEKAKDQPKREEWALKLMEYPDFNDNFEVRMIFVAKYAEKQDPPKAADYAQQALKALALARRPEAISQVVWIERTKSVEHGCYDIVGKNHYFQHKWPDAIQAFQKALRVKLYDEGYFYIGQAQLHQEDVDNALLSFAKAEYLGGSLKAQATKYLEETYKGQHNQNLTGIDKTRNTAKLEIEALRKQMERKDE